MQVVYVPYAYGFKHIAVGNALTGEYIGGVQIKLFGISAQAFFLNRNIYDFAGFCGENFPGIDRDFVYPYFTLPVNQGTGNLYTISEDNKILSGAFVADYSGYGYISFVSTAAQARGKGCAGTIIKTILADLQNKPARLVCRNELVNFYENLGFKKTDKLYLYKISE